jgi:raffinose/stachyose/melibiose transport system permease protein
MPRLRLVTKDHYQNEGYLFILPIFIFFGVFCLYPILFNFYYSYFEWNGISRNKIYVGLANFKTLFGDPIIVKIIQNFCIFFPGTVFPQAFLGIIIAYIINRNIRFGTFFRVLLYLPSILTISIVGTIFSRILETNLGEINTILRWLKLDFLALHWLAKPHLALFSLIMVNIWTYTGFSMLLYSVNMTFIPGELYEAATIDGANLVHQFFRLTIPLLKNTHLSLILLGSINTLKAFDLPYVLTAAGPNHATEFFSTYIYNLSFSYFEQGLSSAVVCLLFVIALALTVVQLRVYGVLGKRGE